MAYLQSEQSWWPTANAPARVIRLGDAERQVILRARRDLQARRRGTRIADPRLEALRLYAMVGRYRRDAVLPLLAAGFSPTERRVVDAMLDALPMRTRAASRSTGRLVCAMLILLPLLFATGAYNWASLYLQDRLIGIVFAGLSLLLLTPFASALTPRRHT